MDEKEPLDRIDISIKKLDTLRHHLINLQTIFKGFQHQFKKLEEEILNLIEEDNNG